MARWVRLQRSHQPADGRRNQARRDLFGYIEGFDKPHRRTRHWAISASPRPDAEWLNPIHRRIGSSWDRV